LLVDLLIFSQLMVPKSHLDPVESSQWKQAYEDLINLGAIQSFRDELPVEQLEALAGFLLSGGLDKLANTSAFTCEESLLEGKVIELSAVLWYSQAQKIPMTYGRDDLDLAPYAKSVSDIIGNETRRRASFDVKMEHRVGEWILKLGVPRIFAPEKREPGWKPGEVVWIAPDDLASLLKRHGELTQLRNHVRNLAARDPSKPEVQQYLANASRNRESRLRVADIVFEVIDLVPAVVPPELGLLLTGVTKVAKFATQRVLSHPYRWLLMTEKIDAIIKQWCDDEILIRLMAFASNALIKKGVSQRSRREKLSDTAFFTAGAEIVLYHSRANSEESSWKLPRFSNRKALGGVQLSRAAIS
jgi:hypothetical protein